MQIGLFWENGLIAFYIADMSKLIQKDSNI